MREIFEEVCYKLQSLPDAYQALLDAYQALLDAYISRLIVVPTLA